MILNKTLYLTYISLTWMICQAKSIKIEYKPYKYIIVNGQNSTNVKKGKFSIKKAKKWK